MLYSCSTSIFLEILSEHVFQSEVFEVQLQASGVELKNRSILVENPKTHLKIRYDAKQLADTASVIDCSLLRIVRMKIVQYRFPISRHSTLNIIA